MPGDKRWVGSFAAAPAPAEGDEKKPAKNDNAGTTVPAADVVRSKAEARGGVAAVTAGGQ